MKRPSDYINSIGPPWFWKEFHACMVVVWFVFVVLFFFVEAVRSIEFLAFVTLVTAFSSEMSAMPAEAARAVLEEDDDC